MFSAWATLVHCVHMTNYTCTFPYVIVAQDDKKSACEVASDQEAAWSSCILRDLSPALVRARLTKPPQRAMNDKKAKETT